MTDKIITQPHDPAITKLVLDAFKEAGCGEVKLDDVFNDIAFPEDMEHIILDVAMYLENELDMVLPLEANVKFVYGCVGDVVSYVEKKLKEANKTYTSSKKVPTPKVAEEKGIKIVKDPVNELILDRICEQMGTGVQDIEMSDNLHDDLGMDSLDLIEIVMKLEKETMVELPDAECRMLLYGTVDDMVVFVKHELKKANKTYTGQKAEPQIKTPSATSQVFGMPQTEPKIIVSGAAKPEPTKPFNVVVNWIRENFKGLVH